jgi:uncharacterized protein (TIGR00251 family)
MATRSPTPSAFFPAHTASGGIVIAVRAAPKARREGIEGVEERPRGAALKVAVTAAPSEGRANISLMKIIADALDVPASAVSIRTGITSRDKTVFVAGEPDRLLKSLKAHCERTS